MEEKKSRSQVVTILKALSRNRMAVLGLVILIILLFTGIFAHVIAPYDFAKQNLADLAVDLLYAVVDPKVSKE